MVIPHEGTRSNGRSNRGSEELEFPAMPISAGARLGPYQIVSPLGAGGMGEVFRARDTRLGRDVAIKLKPPARTA